ncbi:MAG: ABC transporter ATP-binding protein [Myxococcota bacterium]
MSSAPSPEVRPHPTPRDGAPAAIAPTAFLRRLAERTGIREDPAAISAQGEQAVAQPTWQQTLELQCAALGMRTHRVIWSLREAFGAAGRGCALVSQRIGAGGSGEYFALDGHSLRRVRIAFEDGRSDALDLAALAAWTASPEVDAPRSWLVVEPRHPASLVPPTADASVGAGPDAHGPGDGDAAGHPAGHANGHAGPSPFERLLTLLRPDRSDLWAIVAYAAAIGGISLATPIAVQQLVNSIAFGGLVQPVVVLALLLLAALAVSAVLSAVQSWVTELIQQRIFVRVVIDVADRLPRVQARAFDRHHGPELVNRVFDVVTVQKSLSMLLLEGTSLVLQTGAGLLILSFYHPLMLAFSGLLVAGIFVVVVVLGRRAVPTAIAESKAKYDAVGWLQELARHPSTFRDAEQRRFARQHADTLVASWVGARSAHFRIVLRQLIGALALQGVASSALLALGGMLVVQGQLTLGQLVASELIITLIVSTVAKFGKQLEKYYDLLAAMDKLSVVFDLPLERDGGTELPPAEGPAGLEVAGVRFGYGAHPVLHDLDLRIEPGDRVALEGPPGSGKSSLLDLLFGLRPPSSGHLAIDGRDYRDLSLESLRQSVALVRRSETFAGTVRENLRVGRRGFDDAEMLRALEAVGLVEVMRQLPQGLDTRLSTDGRPLSQVQLARLMIARAMLSRPRVLLLDRVFEDLDPQARERIGDVVFADDAPWTTLVVTGREDVLARCTRRIRLMPIDDAEAFAPAPPPRPASERDAPPAEVVPS